MVATISVEASVCKPGRYCQNWHAKAIFTCRKSALDERARAQAERAASIFLGRLAAGGMGMPTRPSVAILTSTGGAGTLVSDDLGMAGFDTPAPDAATAEALRALQTGDHAVLDRNPIDVTLAGLQPALLRGAINVLLQSDSYDALTIIVGSSSLAMPELLAGAIQDCLPNSDKPVIAYVSPHAPEVGALLTQRGVPAFAAAESCTAALRAMFQVAQLQPQAEASAPAAPVAVDDLPSGSLDEYQAKQLFTRFGVPARASASWPRPPRPRPQRASWAAAWC